MFLLSLEPSTFSTEKVVPTRQAMEVPEHPEGFAGLFLGPDEKCSYSGAPFSSLPFILNAFSVFLINLYTTGLVIY